MINGRHSLEEPFSVPQEFLSKEVLYLAVIFYSDGNTFGTTHGYPHFCGVSDTCEGAQKLIDDELSSDNKYKPWVGYFSSLGNTRVFSLTLVKQ
jgi:hypothetical protein